MKKFKNLIVLLLAILVIPMAVFAEGEEGDPALIDTQSKEVNVYFFRGEGCPHCQDAETWFQSIEEEYGSYFQIVDYETWYNEENAELMQKVAKARNESAEGVPYIIVGNKSWSGFAEDYEEELLSEIKSEFEKDVDSRYDIMKLLDDMGNKEEKEEESNGAVALLITILVVGGLGFGIYKARKSIK